MPPYLVILSLKDFGLLHSMSHSTSFVSNLSVQVFLFFNPVLLLAVVYTVLLFVFQRCS